MKKIGIPLITLTVLTLGYLYFCGCCPETCCETATECQTNEKAETALYQVKIKE